MVSLEVALVWGVREGRGRRCLRSGDDDGAAVFVEGGLGAWSVRGAGFVFLEDPG